MITISYEDEEELQEIKKLKLLLTNKQIEPIVYIAYKLNIIQQLLEKNNYQK